MSGKVDWREDEPTEPGESTATAPASPRARGHGHGAHLYLCFDSSAPLRTPLRISLASFDEVTIGRGREPHASVQMGEVRRLELRRPDRLISTDHARLVRIEGAWTI